MSKLEIKNLNKTYGPGIVPVKDISLSVDEGEFLTLLGPSGCGKSTTLRLIAGLEQPTRGDIFIGGKRVTSVQAGDRNIAMVFQSYALYPHMTVYENMASGLKLRKMPSDEIKRRVREASQLLGLENLFDRKPSNLSGGQRQRVALGRALVRNPDVFLLDEPLSNLDALLREQVRADLKQLFETQQAPVVYVTHDQVEAMTLSSKVAVLYEGDVQQLDPPERIYTHPANRFVAGFIGSPQMNIWNLPIDGGKAMLGKFGFPVPDAVRSAPEVLLGIRPEHIRLASPDDAYTVRGKVFLVENLGMSNLLSIHVEDANYTIRALLPAEHKWGGEDVTLAIAPRMIHWFDSNTETRIAETEKEHAVVS